MTDEINWDVLAVIDACRMEANPRIVAILPVAFMEAHLIELIKRKMPGLNHDLRKKLFKDDGLLGPVSAKIDMAEAMGAITAVTARQAVLLARVRNRFAHRIDIADFDHPEIVELVEKLAKAPKQVAVSIRTEEGLESLLKNDVKGKFVRAALTVCVDIFRETKSDFSGEITNERASPVGQSASPSK